MFLALMDYRNSPTEAMHMQVHRLLNGQEHYYRCCQSLFSLSQLHNVRVLSNGSVERRSKHGSIIGQTRRSEHSSQANRLDHPLLITDSAKYRGITISNDLKWTKHVSNITSKANGTLGILRRNLRLSSHTVKTHAYQALVRSHLEYASAVWDPSHTLQYSEIRDGAASRGPVRLQPLAQYRQRHRNAQTAGVGPSGHA